MAVPLKRLTLAAFAAPCLPLTGVGLPLIVYLPPYYAGTLGLDLALTGIIFSAVRWIDLPLDIVFGHGIDRTDTKWGRFRPWMVIGGLVMMAGLALVFFAEPGLSPLRAFLGLLLMYAGYSAAAVAHTSWGQALSTDYHERSRIFGWWQGTNMIALMGLLAVPPLVNALGPRWGLEPSTALGVHAMGWVLLALMLPALLAVSSGVPDAAPLHVSPQGWGDVKTALKRPLLQRLLLIDLLATLPAGFGGALLVFFFEAARGFSQADARLLLLFYFAAGLIGAPLWGWVARRTSKHMAVAWAIGSYAVLHMGLVLAPNAGFWVAAAGMLLAGIPAVAPPFLVRAMLADVTDAETLATGRSNAGLYYAVLVGVQKLGYAIPVGLAYAVLDAVGFDAKLGAANTQSAIDDLVMLFLVPPVVSAVGAAWLARGWTIDRAAQQQIIAELHGK
ncbi:MFS transporter [Sandarakinorhabdus limnophila]|uniref:MFS transporter n=1 Tax=Sandarakinorhabdus limnophila TaxID=210512 RepID=UPI0026ED80BB|nr:MFS transporter [Sandarakinorhabdus limnophila]